MRKVLWQYGVSVVDEYKQHIRRNAPDIIDVEPLRAADMDALGYKMSEKQVIYEGLMKPFDVNNEVDYDWLTKDEYMEKNKLIRPTYLDDMN